ncbi:rRNA-processing protein NOP12 [Aspergillus candidus]|uniref:Nucleolar protein 12 n=1 Tax=Aspergillus candidus TaxID=41067 RepID=A0A2I2F5R3_ASPCN|nr:hypothetical protein BDW47DRAFT_109301 [Aspergillus candidus]PLB35999.1 hypothetical protein BDW47DRAFT_109301 [Aspergillus candidus]
MGKKSKSQSAANLESGNALFSGKTAVDPTLASLFDQSAGPVKEPTIPEITPRASSKRSKHEVENDEEISEPEDGESIGGDDDDEVMGEAPESPSDADSDRAAAAAEAPSRKRKRATTDDLEDSYMRRLEKEEQKSVEKRRAEQTKQQKSGSDEESGSSDGSDEDESSDEAATAPPKHESHAGDASELDKSNRTIFLGNVSTEAIKSKSGKKTLMRHLESFLSSIPESTGPHKLESLRFRSTAFASGGKVPKRAAFAKQELLDETTPSTNAYAVYSTIQGARKAPHALNGTVVLDRHLRADSIAHPAKVDNKRCVFVGNLDFVDVEGDTEEKKNKKRAPADVEEGLWRTFDAHTGGSKDQKSKVNKCSVESVRVVRDRLTRVGKGFAYVQFHDPNCVEEALLLDGKKFPPMLPRKLRVTRARKMMKKREDAGNGRQTEAAKTLQGRAGRLFGRAGAAQLKSDGQRTISGNSAVFEGQRATEGDSNRLRVKTKSRGSKGSKGKPNNRSSKRAAAYQAAGGRQAKVKA